MGKRNKVVPIGQTKKEIMQERDGFCIVQESSFLDSIVYI